MFHIHVPITLGSVLFMTCEKNPVSKRALLTMWPSSPHSAVRPKTFEIKYVGVSPLSLRLLTSSVVTLSIAILRLIEYRLGKPYRYELYVHDK